MDGGRARQVPRVRSRRGLSAPSSPTRSSYRTLDLSRISPGRMLRHLRESGHIPEQSNVPSGSGVPASQPVASASQSTLADIETVVRRVLAQAQPVTPTPNPTTASPATAAPTPSNSGKPMLKFPDPPVFEGDPVKLEGWITQTQMYLRAYDVDLSSIRAVEVATMFLRGKAQDWWTGQFLLQASGSAPILGTWTDFVQALTVAFRPVELHKRYVDQMLTISQGKQDMRSYIASFNALRAKIPQAFPEQTLSHLFLQGCRADLQRNIALQYPKTLAEHFQHAIVLSDLPGNSKHPPVNSKEKADKSKSSQPVLCSHCHKPGHTVDRCFQLHPELKKQRSKTSKT